MVYLVVLINITLPNKLFYEGKKRSEIRHVRTSCHSMYCKSFDTEKKVVSHYNLQFF